MLKKKEKKNVKKDFKLIVAGCVAQAEGEEIKKRSPIWKKEHYTDNQSDWLKGNPIAHGKN